MQYTSYYDGVSPNIYTGTLLVTPTMGFRNLSFGNFPTNQINPLNPYDEYLDIGYYTITVTCNNSYYRSVLPYYHWGVINKITVTV